MSCTNKAYIASLAGAEIDATVRKKREEALKNHVPVAEESTLQFLLVLLSALRPKRILEIGTATGLSAVAILQRLPEARLTTIELEEERYRLAKENLQEGGVADRATCYLGDAGEILAMMDVTYDFVFLDGPKAQYPKYMQELKRMLPKGGVVFADDVLLFGWVSGETPVPEKHRLFVRKMRKYLQELSLGGDFTTSIIDVGDGVALSVKK